MCHKTVECGTNLKYTYINLQCKILKTFRKNIINHVYSSVNTFVWVIKPNLLVIYREIIVAYPEIHNNHRHIVRWPNVEVLSVKPGGTFSNHWVLKGYTREIVMHFLYPLVSPNIQHIPDVLTSNVGPFKFVIS